MKKVTRNNLAKTVRWMVVKKNFATGRNRKRFKKYIDKWLISEFQKECDVSKETITHKISREVEKNRLSSNINQRHIAAHRKLQRLNT